MTVQGMIAAIFLPGPDIPKLRHAKHASALRSAQPTLRFHHFADRQPVPGQVECLIHLPLMLSSLGFCQ